MQTCSHSNMPRNLYILLLLFVLFSMNVRQKHFALGNWAICRSKFLCKHLLIAMDTIATYPFTRPLTLCFVARGEWVVTRVTVVVTLCYQAPVCDVYLDLGANHAAHTAPKIEPYLIPKGECGAYQAYAMFTSNRGENERERGLFLFQIALI